MISATYMGINEEGLYASDSGHTLFTDRGQRLSPDEVKSSNAYSHMSLHGGFLHSRMQRLVANLLFPAGQGDWYANKSYGTEDLTPFDDFRQKQRNDPESYYYSAFQGMDIALNLVPSQLALAEVVKLEVLTCTSENKDDQLPGTGKHIVYFPGADTYYQACFRDITTAARETGATVHAFNFPGTGLSTGKVNEANDLTNAGLAIVRSLLAKGIHPDDIILQGDCFGAAIALEVKEQLALQAGMNVSLIMNNAFRSFEAAVTDMILSSSYLPNFLTQIVKVLLQFTGWHVTPGDKYMADTPYQVCIQHRGDQVLPSGTLSDHLQEVQAQEGFEDPCPESYKAERDAIADRHVLRVRQDAKERLGKFGHNKFGQINPHFADLCELETLGKKPAYSGFVNDYLEASNRYKQAHPQSLIDPVQAAKEIKYLPPAEQIRISEEEAKQMLEFERHFAKLPEQMHAQEDALEEKQQDSDNLFGL